MIHGLDNSFSTALVDNYNTPTDGKLDEYSIRPSQWYLLTDTWIQYGWEIQVFPRTNHEIARFHRDDHTLIGITIQMTEKLETEVYEQKTLE